MCIRDSKWGERWESRRYRFDPIIETVFFTDSGRQINSRRNGPEDWTRFCGEKTSWTPDTRRHPRFQEVLYLLQRDLDTGPLLHQWVSQMGVWENKYDELLSEVSSKTSEETLDFVIAVSYTHMTLPTTPYV